MSPEPQLALLRAAQEALSSHVRDLRERGWAVEVVAYAEPFKLAAEIDLGGLKVPVEALRTPPEVAANEAATQSGEGERP